MGAWVKQLTRENTLLDRSLRSIAYAWSVQEIGKAKMNQCPVVGRGRITSWYYSTEDYAVQQKIIRKEFSGAKADRMGQNILLLLEQGNAWADQGISPLSRDKFLEILHQYNKHHAHARGAIVYSYWGEPWITTKLRAALKDQITESELDITISSLSVPRLIKGSLTKLYHPSKDLERKKRVLLNKLNLNREAQELVNVLGWFTLLYELGERVSAKLYDNLLRCLRAVTTQAEMELLEWYDPISLEQYFKGKELPQEEINRRKEMYILTMGSGTLQVLSGKKAHAYFNKNFGNLETKARDGLTELKGTVASKGVVQGIVKIVVTQEDQAKLKQGEILVSPMTTPYLMSAVKRAAAIVTDEGGMTAHAAIVSREFKIPCIVGTKIATQVFKDGDLVEVDATAGIVRIIN